MARLISHVFCAKALYAVITMSQSVDGFWFEDGECSVLPVEAHDRELGSLIEMHIQQSVRDQVVERPFDNKSVLKALRCRSWRGLYRIAECVTVTLFPGSHIEIEHMLRNPEGGEYLPNAAGKKTLPADASTETIGSLVKQMMLSKH